ncbi:MAG: efflux RND transporter periplasmic adaptor subunit [Alphaproteobacteria bacterium]|nr:efflux RND transporter periplasmic adaptor subunit [Alphaproteobacteria bacterium]
MDTMTREAADRKAETERRTRRLTLGRAAMALSSLLVLAAIGYAIWLWPFGNARSGAQNANRNDAIPVLVATAATKDVPVYLDGLGTVQALYTVTVRAMVDGQLIEVRFKEGQEVAVGDVLARIDPRTYQAALDQAVAKKAQDQANLANARVDLARYQKLASTAYTSAQQADTQKALVAQLEAQVQQDQAAIDTARTQLSYTTITSPIDGLAGIRQVDQGNIVHTTDTNGIVVLTTMHPISVIFTLPQQTLSTVAAAMREGTPEVVATLQGIDPGHSPVLDRGTLSVLDNQVDPTTGTIKLKATFPNPDYKLWPGGFVGVRLNVATEHNVIVVPPAAVQRGPSGPFVYVLGDDGTVKRQDVTVGHQDESNAVIVSGLAAGARVVTDGVSRLTDGSKAVVAQVNPNAGAGPPQPAAPGARQSRAPS